MTDRRRVCREIGCPFVTGAGATVAGNRILRSVRQARAFARGETSEGFVVHEPARSGQPMQQQSREEAQEIERARQAALKHDQ